MGPDRVMHMGVRTVAILQPTYLPYLGYFALIERADHFVFLDDAQFCRESYHQRNRIWSKGENENRLKIPVVKQPQKTALIDMRIESQKPWQDQHLKCIFETYHQAPHFPEIYSWLSAYFQTKADETHLSQFTSHLIMEAAKGLKLKTEFHYASERPSSLRRSERLDEILSCFKATDYISPMGSLTYIETDNLLGQRYKLHYLNYKPIAYPQAGGEFLPYLGFIDALMWLGWDETRALITQSAAADFFMP